MRIWPAFLLAINSSSNCRLCKIVLLSVRLKSNHPQCFNTWSQRMHIVPSKHVGGSLINREICAAMSREMYFQPHKEHIISRSEESQTMAKRNLGLKESGSESEDRLLKLFMTHNYIVPAQRRYIQWLTHYIVYSTSLYQCMQQNVDKSSQWGSTSGRI